MKKLFTLVSLIAISSVAHAQWTLQNTGFTSAVGIQDMSIASPQVAWAIADDNLGATSAFTRTINGGTTWTSGSITDVGITDFTGTTISALGADTAWIGMYGPVIGQGRIYRTTNGGATWTRQNLTGYTNAASFLNIVHFFNGNNGVAIGDPVNGVYEIYTTSNSGLTWTAVPSANIPAPLIIDEWGVINLYSAVGNTIWFGTINGRVFKSTDMGLNWTASSTGLTGTTTNHAMEDITFADANNGIIRDGSVLVKTTDGGTTWTPVTYTGPLNITDISSVPTTPNTFVSVGTSSSYTVNSGTTWTGISPSPTLNHVTFYNSTTGWAGGTSSTTGTGGIYKWSGPALFASKDVAVTVISSPAATICSTAGQTMCIQVQNQGLTPAANFPVSYSINGGTPVTETYTATIQPGATVSYCFSAQHAFTAPGAYTVVANAQLTDDDNTSNNSATSTITSNAIVSFAASADATICSGQSATLSASGADNYTWQPGNTSGASLNASPATTTTYTVTGSNAAGCSVTEQVTINVVQTVPLALSSTADTICNGQSVTLSASGADTYAWSNGMTGSSITISPGTTTSIIATGTIGGSCSNTDTITVAVNATPVNPVSIPAISICSGNTLTLNAAGLPGDNYTWTGPVGFYNNNQTATISNAGTNRTGIYTVSVSNAANCSASGTVQVSVSQSPVMTVTNSGPICIGQSATLVAQGAGSYSWSTGQTSDLVIVTPGSTTTYTVTGSAGNSCTTTLTTTVEVVQLPQLPNLPASITVCEGDSVELNPGGAPGNYIWTGPNGFNSTAINPVIAQASLQNDGNITLIMTQGGCSTTPMVINLNVNELPDSMFTFTGSANGNVFTFNPVSNFGTYSWTFQNGTPATSTDENPVVAFSTMGNNLVTLTVSNQGCATSSTQTILVSSAAEEFANGFRIYPNPSSGKVKIDLAATGVESAKVTVLNSMGQAVATEKLQAQTMEEINLTHLAAGAYLLQIETAKGIQVKQVLIQK